MSSQELARALGAILRLGGAGPSRSAPLGDFVDAIALSLLGFKCGDLGEDRLEPAGQGGEIPQGVARLDLSREDVAEIAERLESVARLRGFK